MAKNQQKIKKRGKKMSKTTKKKLTKFETVVEVLKRWDEKVIYPTTARKLIMQIYGIPNFSSAEITHILHKLDYEGIIKVTDVGYEIFKIPKANKMSVLIKEVLKDDR